MKSLYLQMRELTRVLDWGPNVWHFLVPSFLALIFIWYGAIWTCDCIPNCWGPKACVYSIEGCKAWSAYLWLTEDSCWWNQVGFGGSRLILESFRVFALPFAYLNWACGEAVSRDNLYVLLWFFPPYGWVHHPLTFSRRQKWLGDALKVGVWLLQTMFPLVRVFGVWLVGWSMLEHANSKQVRSGRLIGSKQQPSSLNLSQMIVRRFNPPHQARRRFEMANLGFT